METEVHAGVEVSALSLRRTRVVFAVAVLIFALLIFLVQSTAHAYTSEFGTQDHDEASHFMTGLMIHDYVAYGFPGSPMRFARNHYLHYPKSAFGVWPPLLHVAEACWMLLFSPTRLSMMIFMGLITLALAASFFHVARQLTNPYLAATAGMVLVLMPIVVRSAITVMADGLVAVLSFWAMYCFARFLASGQTRYLNLFTLTASLCVLTKANGLALVPLPMVSILLSGEWNQLRNRRIWGALLVILLVAAPQNLFLWKFAQSSLGVGLLQGTVWMKTVEYNRFFGVQLGLSLLPLFLIGLIVAYRDRGSSRGSWLVYCAAASEIVTVLAFHCFVPKEAEARYLIATLPAALLFGCRAVRFLAETTKLVALRPWIIAVTAIYCIGIFSRYQLSIPQIGVYGYRVIAEQYAGTTAPQVFLISSEDKGEGVGICEIALRDPKRPTHFVLRASKVLSHSGWDGGDYQLAYTTAEQVGRFLDSVPVQYVLFDDHASRVHKPHHDLLKTALQAESGHWFQLPSSVGNTTIAVYKNSLIRNRSGVKFTINMQHSLQGEFKQESR